MRKVVVDNGIPNALSIFFKKTTCSYPRAEMKHFILFTNHVVLQNETRDNQFANKSEKKS